MGISKSAYSRYRIIENMLKNPFKPYPTLGAIQEACENKLDFSPSLDTLEKDIRNMKQSDVFDAPRSFAGPSYPPPKQNPRNYRFHPEQSYPPPPPPRSPRSQLRRPSRGSPGFPGSSGPLGTPGSRPHQDDYNKSIGVST